MGLINKLRNYLNEDTDFEDLPEESAKDKKPKKAKKKKNKEKTSEKQEKDAKRYIEEYDSLLADIGEDSERKTVQDFCEQLVDVTFHMEDMKREYKVVTSYLTDIQRIEELPVELANDLMDTARKVEMLDKNKETYSQSENLLPEEQYNRMAALEKEVPQTIVKLNEMEMQDSMLKSDMGHLQGEKEDLRYMRSEYADGIIKLRGILITVLTIFFLMMGVVLSIALLTKKNVTVYALAIGAVAVIVFVIAYIRYISLQTEIKESDAKTKRAVSLLNKVKVKFINNTNTLEYIYDKYGINSAKELEYQWEQYNRMVKDALRYSQASSDYRVYCDELVSKLSKLGLSDPYVWPKQIKAILDRREMVEIKHSLNTRRQKLRDKVATCEKIKSNALTALRAAVIEDPGMERYIHELLAPYHISIDS